MNLAESIKVVLKTRSQIIFKNFLKEDLIIIFKEMGGDLLTLSRVGKSSVSSLRGSGFKKSIARVVSTGSDTILIFKLLPKRIKQGFFKFKEDFLVELEKLPTQKEKTVFCIKVVAALVSMSIPRIYMARKTPKKFSFSGIKNRNAFTQFIVTQIGFKFSQIIIFRFLEAVEDELTEPEDLKTICYFKDLITGGSHNYKKLEEMDLPAPGDPSFQLLENLKQFIMTGET